MISLDKVKILEQVKGAWRLIPGQKLQVTYRGEVILQRLFDREWNFREVRIFEAQENGRPCIGAYLVE